MSTNFPGSLDNFTNPTAADNLNTPAVLHSDQHANENDAIEALEAKVGIDGSLVTGSLDYRVGQLEVSGHSPVTLGVANGLSLSGQTLSMGLAGANSTGTLSAQDWNTFNSKQSSLTFPLASSLGGTSISNTGTFTNHSNTTIIGGGTISLGGVALTIPAAGTAALLERENLFTAKQQIIHAFAGTTNGYAAFDSQFYANPSSSTGNAFNNVTIQTFKEGANNLGALTGLQASVYNQGAGDVTLALGFKFIGGVLSTGAIGTLRIVDLQAFGVGAGNITTAIGVNIQDVGLGTAGATANAKAINIEAASGAVTNDRIGLYIGNQSGGAGNYSIYTNSGGVRLGGNVTFAATYIGMENAGSYVGFPAVPGQAYIPWDSNFDSIINSLNRIYINIDSANSGAATAVVIGKARSSTSGGTDLFRFGSDGNVGIYLADSFFGYPGTTAQGFCPYDASFNFIFNSIGNHYFIIDTDNNETTKKFVWGKDATTPAGQTEIMSLTEAGLLTLMDGANIAVNATTGTKIGTATTQKLGFYGATPITQPTEITDELTTITFTAPGTPDYAIQDLIDSSGGAAFGFATKDEGNTVLSVVANLQARVNALETTLVNLGLLADAD